ncbi:monocarboxylate transporter 5-like isoform X1 [Leptidea sinapis]|uniref:monocarboxylate transporter 5-like isoform X1 n=2 Tax=Leptidea sinapis TaxID=189913 RepID=UPI002138B815|nr:monocarboxylate transporter 5-like isoform X1 [Leptidea sinapis]
MSTKNLASVPRTEKRIKLIPPDGGWGWMILLGTGLSNIFNQSMLSLFSLVYGDALEAMGHDTKGAAIVMSTMLFVTNFGGPVAGAIVKLTSPRFVCVLGAFFCTAGIFLSAFSTHIIHLVISYGVLLGTGLGFIQNASFVAINSYFKVKKSIAVGLAMAGTGIGQTLMPHVVRYLLESYGFKGACLLLSSLSLHGICGTMLIQPVEWHMKKIEEEVIIDEQARLLEDNVSSKNKDYTENGNLEYKSNRRATEPNVISKNGVEKNPTQRISQSDKDLSFEKNGKSVGIKNFKMDAPSENKSLLRKLYDLFGISLLSSPRFINVVVGTSLTVVSIQNFSMIYPLFLQKKALMTKQETANCMSAVAFADIIGRLSLPQVQSKFNISARMMLILTSIWLLVVRQFLAYQSNMYVLLMMSVLYGFGRSMIIVARNIAISEKCRMDQVAAAVGLGMLTMGIIVPPTGYFLGWIRDYTNSYIICITAQNALLVIFLAMWIPDMFFEYIQEKKKRRKGVDEVQLS